MAMRIISLCTSVVCVFALTGCASWFISYPHPERLAVTPARALESAHVAQLAAQLQRRTEELHAARMLGDLTVIREGYQLQGRQAIVGKLPDMLRLETFPQGAVYTLALLVTRGGTLSYSEPQEKRTYEDSDTALEKFTQLPVTPADFLALVTGRVPLRYLPHGERGDTVLQRDDGTLAVTVAQGMVEYLLSAEGTPKLFRFWEDDRDSYIGELVLVVRDGRVRAVDICKENGDSASLRFTRYEENVVIKDELFIKQ
jgi:hypothetical protein